MKKTILAVILVTLSFLLVSCNIPFDFIGNEGGSSSNSETSTETNTNTENKDNVNTSTESGTNTSTESGTNTNTNTGTGNGTNTGTSSSNDDDVIEKNVFKFQYTFAYDHIFSSSGEPYATLLIDDSYLSLKIDEPKDITAGDILCVEITNGAYFVTQESYPGHTHLVNGEMVSYWFEYSDVYILSGGEITPQNVRDSFDFRWGNEYVILDRDGRYVSLDEYEGSELYLVLDKERADKIDSGKIEPERDEAKIPIACALAYNPRKESDGYTTADLREQKVTINLDWHSHEMDEIWEDDRAKGERHAGYIGYNENGNEYIKYAPNNHSYLVFVDCIDKTDKGSNDVTNDAWIVIENVLDSLYIDENGASNDVYVDATEISNDKILISFPSFESYSQCQESLLNGLSQLDSVEKIDIHYLESQAEGTELNSYEAYYSNEALEVENTLISSYEQLNEVLRNYAIDENVSKITEKTFESNYVIYTYAYSSSRILLPDFGYAKIIDGNLYLTQYNYESHGFLLDQIDNLSCVFIIIPKEDLIGELKEGFLVNYINVDFYCESYSVNEELDGEHVIEDLDSELQ